MQRSTPREARQPLGGSSRRVSGASPWPPCPSRASRRWPEPAWASRSPVLIDASPGQNRLRVTRPESMVLTRVIISSREIRKAFAEIARALGSGRRASGHREYPRMLSMKSAAFRQFHHRGGQGRGDWAGCWHHRGRRRTRATASSAVVLNQASHVIASIKKARPDKRRSGVRPDVDENIFFRSQNFSPVVGRAGRPGGHRRAS